MKAVYTQQRNFLREAQRYTKFICNPQHKARLVTNPPCAAPPHKVGHCKIQPLAQHLLQGFAYLWSHLAIYMGYNNDKHSQLFEL
jgi:hypothetical protein